MNANNNVNVANQDTSGNNWVNVNYPTARVVTGILGFLALCTIATNYAVNAVFDMNVFLSVIATALVTCFATCTSDMWKNGFQVFTGNVENVADACCFWNTASRGFLVACAIFSAGAFFSATGATTLIAALAPVFFPFFVGICGYYVCRTISNASAYCAINTENVNSTYCVENVTIDTNVTTSSNARKATSGVTVNS
ncbi:MAG: hypothetical protein VX764_09330 [Planctomycetota bacterium]|nr:hypothetical protein [Planctomycetota bacterium]